MSSNKTLILMSTKTTTEDNLDIAFSGESKANRKYLFYAKQAEKDGFPMIAKLFRAVASAETVHAEGHFLAMDGVKSTKTNLEDAYKGEVYEYTEMYPSMLEQAQTDNHKAQRMFRLALSAERIHAELWKKALEAVSCGKDLEEMDIWVCPVCGFVECGPRAPEKCPICGLPGLKFMKAN